ncbi:MAG: amidohydrolase family protein [Acidobacteriota bacterium]
MLPLAHLGGDPALFLRRTRGRPYMTHVAEGRSERSRLRASARSPARSARGASSPTASVFPATTRGGVQSAGATLVPLPAFERDPLYGAGPDVPMLQEEGVRLALGSDSPISGPGDLLEDLDAARKLGLDEAAAMDAVTRIPAATFGRPDLGVLRTGAPADLLFADAADADLGKGRASVAMVMTAGIARYASRAGLIAATGREETALGGGGWVEARLGRWASKLSAGSPPAT